MKHIILVGVWLGVVLLINQPSLIAQPNITRIEYFIDNDPGLSLATSVSITPGVNLQNIVIPLNPTNLSEGIHRLFVRARNANGNWSMVNSWIFYKPMGNGTLPPLPATTDIKRIEYFIDNDPGIGNAIPLAYTKGTVINDLVGSINVTGLSVGDHKLLVRAQSTNGSWSLVNEWSFSIDNLLAAPAITVNSVSKTTLCAWDSVQVGLHTTGNYANGNTFKIFVSDASGSFATETEIGTLSATGSGIVNGRLPAHLATGAGYKIRVKSSNPVMTSAASTATLTIRDRPYPSVISGITKVNGGFTHPYSIPVTAGSSYNWMPQGGSQGSGNQTAAITVNWAIPIPDSLQGKLDAIETNQYGCAGDTSRLSPVIIYKLDIGDTVSASVCKGDILVIKAGITGSFNAGNLLTAQLSNATGNFNSPTAIATVAYAGNGVNKLATINLSIPANLPNGNGYSVRIRSSLPVFTGDSSTDIAIQKPNLGDDIAGTYCQGLSYNLTQHFTNNALTYGYYTHVFAPVALPAGVQAGIYYAVGVNGFGCPDTSQVTVSLLPKPNIGADTTVYHVCAGETTNLLPLFNTVGLGSSWNSGNPTSATPGIYRLIVTNTQGCKDTAFANVVLPTALWTGINNSNWHNPANWNTGKVPDAGTHVIIQGATPNPCIISNDHGYSASILLKSGGTLQQTNGKQLYVNGKCTVLPSL